VAALHSELVRTTAVFLDYAPPSGPEQVHHVHQLASRPGAGIAPGQCRLPCASLLEWLDRQTNWIRDLSELKKAGALPLLIQAFWSAGDSTQTGV